MDFKSYKYKDFLKYGDFENFKVSFPDFKDTLEKFGKEFRKEGKNFKIHLAWSGRLLAGVATTNVIQPNWGCWKDSPLNGARWLGNVEINSKIRGMGYGSEFVSEITKKGGWILCANKENENFYKNLGFIPILDNKQGRQVFVKGFTEFEILIILTDRYPYNLLKD